MNNSVVRIGVIPVYARKCYKLLPKGGECKHVEYEVEFEIVSVIFSCTKQLI